MDLGSDGRRKLISADNRYGGIIEMNKYPISERVLINKQIKSTQSQLNFFMFIGKLGIGNQCKLKLKKKETKKENPRCNRI